MRKRNLSKLFLLNLITLGFYEYRWLSETISDITTTSNVPSPPIRRLLLYSGISTLSLGLFFLTTLGGIPHINKQLHAVNSPTQQCILNYAERNDPYAGDKFSPRSQVCNQSVDTFYHAQDVYDRQLYLIFAVIGLSVIVMMISGYKYSQTYNLILAAIAVVVGSSLSKSTVLYGMYNAPMVTMLAIQDALNHGDSGLTARRSRLLRIYTVTATVFSILLGALVYLTVR